MKAKTVFLAIGLWLLSVLFFIVVPVALSYIFFSSVDLVDHVTSPVSMANESFDDIESGVKAFEKKVKNLNENELSVFGMNNALPTYDVVYSTVQGDKTFAFYTFYENDIDHGKSTSLMVQAFTQDPNRQYCFDGEPLRLDLYYLSDYCAFDIKTNEGDKRAVFLLNDEKARVRGKNSSCNKVKINGAERYIICIIEPMELLDSWYELIYD